APDSGGAVLLAPGGRLSARSECPMAGSIMPLPIMEEEAREKRQEKLPPPPKSVVVRYGYLKQIGEFAYGGETTVGCGSKLIIRTDRGTEIATLLTSTCPNAGCGHAVSRKEMLQYIDNSGGKQFPFSTNGKAIRVATVEDMNEQ